MLTWPDPTRQKSWLDPTLGSIRPVENSVSLSLLISLIAKIAVVPTRSYLIDLRFVVMLVCRDTRHSGDHGPSCWNDLPAELMQTIVSWSWDFCWTFENTPVQNCFSWLGTHFWVCNTCCMARYRCQNNNNMISSKQNKGSTKITQNYTFRE